MKDFQVHLSLAMTLLTLLSFRQLPITSSHVFLGYALEKLLLTLKILYSLDEALSSILSRWPNYCSLLSCKHSLVLSDFILVINSSVEVLSSLLTLHIFLTILKSFISSLATFHLQLTKSHIYIACVQIRGMICLLHKGQTFTG